MFLFGGGQLGQLRLACLLLEAGADPCVQDHRGVTPLALAAQQGWAVAVDVLLRAGAQPNVVGKCSASVVLFDCCVVMVATPQLSFAGL